MELFIFFADSFEELRVLFKLIYDPACIFFTVLRARELVWLISEFGMVFKNFQMRIDTKDVMAIYRWRNLFVRFTQQFFLSVWPKRLGVLWHYTNCTWGGAYLG